MTGRRTLLVIAKEPIAGRAKTRLCPPCSPTDAARVALAALSDTLATAAGASVDRRILVLDGRAGPWVPDGVTVLPQRPGGLDRRLAGAFDDADDGIPGPTLLVGMDTPQLTAAALADAFTQLDDHDAVLGLATDGGWWAIGLHRPDPDLFLGIPMSRDDTGARQLARLRDRGLDVGMLPRLQDVDRWPDATSVAALVPGSRFARAVAEVAP